MIIYGHRGARGEAPENTLAGFEHAYRHGIRHFELDLVLSRDGIPVVIHDLTLDRTTPESGKVASRTAMELQTLDARNNAVPWPSFTGIPTLEQVFATMPDFIHIQLEVKSDSRQRLNILCNRLTELVQRNHWHSRVTVTSQDTWFLQQVHRRDPSVSLGLVADKRFPNPVNVAQKIGCKYLCINWRICSESYVEAAHKAGMQVSTWTVNRIQDMLDLEKKGVDSIITDFPTSTQIYFENRARTAGARVPKRVQAEPDGSASPA